MFNALFALSCCLLLQSKVSGFTLEIWSQKTMQNNKPLKCSSTIKTDEISNTRTSNKSNSTQTWVPKQYLSLEDIDGPYSKKKKLKIQKMITFAHYCYGGGHIGANSIGIIGFYVMLRHIHIDKVLLGTTPNDDITLKHKQVWIDACGYTGISDIEITMDETEQEIDEIMKLMPLGWDKKTLWDFLVAFSETCVKYAKKLEKANTEQV